MSQLSCHSEALKFLWQQCIPDAAQCRGDIVDVLCRIMDEDDLPQVRKQKKPTAADQFYADHQRAYEERGRPSRDRVEEVQLHNSGYPKLHDEIRKKQSTTRVTAIDARSANHRMGICTCSNSTRKKRSYYSRRSENYRKRNQLNRITKPKSLRINKKPPKVYKSIITISTGCQISSYSLTKDKGSLTVDNGSWAIHKGSLTIDSEMELDKMAAESSLQYRDLVALRLSKEQSVSSVQSKVSVTSKKSDIAQKSVTDNSSYNTFGSLEQEPMLTE